MKNNSSTTKESTFRLLFDTYYAPLCLYCQRFISNEQVCEDIVQDIFITLWKKDEYICEADSTLFFLKACARNSCLNFLNRQKYEQKYIEYAVYTQSEYNEPLYSIQELQDKLNEALKRIPEMYREVYIMSFMENKKNKEIAELLNISTKTVERYKKKCLTILKEEFKDYIPLLVLLTQIK